MNRTEANPEPVRDSVEVIAGGTTANMGTLFDIGGAAMRTPRLLARIEPAPLDGINLVYHSNTKTPEGRVRGHAGVVALRSYLDNIGIKIGVTLTFEEGKGGFPTGGTGSSAAEAVGAVLAGAVLFDQEMTPEKVIQAAAKGEPDEHMDNVAPAVMGGIVLMHKGYDGKLEFTRIEPPKNLGLALGFSSHNKNGGTEATRKVLDEPVSKDLHISQIQLVAQEILALGRGDVNSFLRVVWQDRFHEPRRAEAGIYGNFNAIEFTQFKEGLFRDYGIGLAVSGAGPSMAFWFDKSRYPNGLIEDIKTVISSWFSSCGVQMRVEDSGIAVNGAYNYVIESYPDSAIAKASGRTA